MLKTKSKPPTELSGLTAAEVQSRRERGLTNVIPNSGTRSVGQILRENILTYFNLIFLVLGAALLVVGSFKNMLFLLVALCNTCIGVFQELRAKKAVDQLTLVAAGTVPTMRGGKRIELRTDELVQDDIVEFSAGSQICADAEVCSGELQVNESLLTGESDAIAKTVGAELRSGSFVISGHALCRLTHVGRDSYAARLAAEAKRGVRSTKSEMMRSLSRLIAVVGIALIPLGALLFYQHHSPAALGLPLKESIESTVAALIGMIPEGLYLLTSVAIAASCLKLTRQRVLMQDLNCVETLAHVDVLCVDKTGTITEPGMEVTELIPLNAEPQEMEAILAAVYHGQEPENDTARAMSARFAAPTEQTALHRIPFTSANKWSGADFGDFGSYVVGAPEFILKDRYDEIRPRVEQCAATGCRTLLLARVAALTEPLDPAAVTPLGLVCLSNRLRPDAKETFQYFAQQGVAVKVISGDNPLTVSEVAKRAGIENADRCIDAATLKTPEDCAEAVKTYTVFGRVTPEQKRHLIRGLKQQGHTVAMTGDGVNDVLAMKDADCGIAMASGSQAAAQIAKIVLLDSKFSAMPGIVAEGRRVINNIQRAASLFLVKNIFSILFTLILMFLHLSYPLQAIQLSLISALTIGIPSFFLALEPNYAKVKGHFMHNVIRRAMPGGLTNVILVVMACLFTKAFHLGEPALNTIAVWVMASVGLLTLYHVSRPFSKLRIAVLSAMTAGMLLCLLVLPTFFELPSIRIEEILVLVVLVLACPTVMRGMLFIFDRSMLRYERRPKRSRKRLRRVHFKRQADAPQEPRPKRSRKRLRRIHFKHSSDEQQ